MRKHPKAISFGKSYQEALVMLASRPEFKVFEKLLLVEQNNIVVRAFKTNSADPQLALKKAHAEGRLFELRLFKRTFDEAVKKSQDE